MDIEEMMSATISTLREITDNAMHGEDLELHCEISEWIDSNLPEYIAEQHNWAAWRNQDWHKVYDYLLGKGLIVKTPARIMEIFFNRFRFMKPYMTMVNDLPVITEGGYKYGFQKDERDEIVAFANFEPIEAKAVPMMVWWNLVSEAGYEIDTHS